MCITRERELWISSPFGLLRVNLSAYEKGDFKFGKKRTDYNKQVRDYMNLLSDMGYENIRGYHF